MVKFFLTNILSDGIMVGIVSEYICPNCKNPIYDDDALLCHFCGESLRRASKGFLSNLRYGKMQYVWIAVALIVVVSFLLLFIF